MYDSIWFNHFYDTSLITGCDICVQSKRPRKFFPQSHSESILLELIHSNICKMDGMLTCGGKCYFIMFIDDFSRYCYFYLWKKKWSFAHFKIYEVEVKNQISCKVKIIKLDRGGENIILMNLVKKMK